MARERLYIVHGTGPDRVGLVGAITTPIARAGGNVVDLRQDVLHGLFTIFLVVDLSATELRAAELTRMVREIGEDTGLELRVDNYTPVAREPEKRSMLMILIGRDRPGIIASISETLGKQRINIEFAQTVGREDVFLMELLTDVSHCALPLDNARELLARTMAAMDIRAMFQTEDVFNKRKRVVLFDARSSFVRPATLSDILQQTGIAAADFRKVYPAKDPAACLKAAAQRLDGFPADVLGTVAAAITPTPETMELLQTLKTMGYRVALATDTFSPLLDLVGRRLGLDHAFGVGLAVDDDSRAVVGEITAEDLAGRDVERRVARLVAEERVARDDVTVVAGPAGAEPIGIRLRLDLGVLLELYNKRSVSRDALIGLLGALGIPRLA